MLAGLSPPRAAGPDCYVITGVRGIHLSGVGKSRPRDAVVEAVSRAKMLWLLRLTEHPGLALSGNIPAVTAASCADAIRERHGSVPGYLATWARGPTGSGRDALAAHPLARHLTTSNPHRRRCASSPASSHPAPADADQRVVLPAGADGTVVTGTYGRPRLLAVWLGPTGADPRHRSGRPGPGGPPPQAADGETGKLPRAADPARPNRLTPFPAAPVQPPHEHPPGPTVAVRFRP